MSAIPFSRTIRSLEADSFGSNVMMLTFALSLLLLWVGWFFLASIPVTQASQTVSVTARGKIIATFTPDVLLQIEQGDPAYLHFQGGSSVTVPAIVTKIEYRSGQVEVFTEQDISSVNELTAIEYVEVEVHDISPAMLVLQVAGLQ